MIVNCPKCNTQFDNHSKWGRKKFCSRKCANSRIQTDAMNASRKINNKKQIPCKFCSRFCGSEGALVMHEKSCAFNPQKVSGVFSGKTHTEQTKRKQGTKNSAGLKIPENLYDVSNRTKVKILQRLGKGCSNCGWNEAACDVHHIIPRSKGGSNEHSNLTLICPNCHRLAHSNKLTKFISIEEYIGEDWKQYYYALDEENLDAAPHTGL